jgi:uncharacterized protein
MTLFMTLFPLYLFGNLHCLGMCGPLVGWICHHPSRQFYFLGRLCSYSLVGLLAGEAGAVLQLSLKHFYLAELLSFGGGLAIFIWGCFQLMRRPFPLKRFSFPLIHRFQQQLSTLLLKETPGATFLFGFLTVALPCGQTLVVFSACALVGDPWVGLFNGFALALLTTPSLVLAMQSFKLFKKFRGYDHIVLGLSSLLVGLLACCRGLAEGGWIPHWIINPSASTLYHIVIF